MGNSSNKAVISRPEVRRQLPREQKYLSHESSKENLLKKRGLLMKKHKQAILSLAKRRPKLSKVFDSRSLEQLRLIYLEKSSSQILKPEKMLKDFSCDLSSISDIEFTKLITTLKVKPCIQSLSLCNSEAQTTFNKKIILLSKNIRTFKALKELSLNFISSPGVKNPPILLLFSKLEACRELRTIKLSLSGPWQIYFQDSLQFIFQSLSKIRLLSNLSLDFGYFDHMESSHFSSISAGILHLRPLSALSLNLKCSWLFTDSDFELLCSCLLRHTHLTKLNLNITGSGKITNDGLEYLGATLIKFSRLSSLALNFSNCSKITVNGIQPFLKMLQALRLLSKVDFCFQQMNAVEKDFIQKVASGFGSLKLLKSLRFDLGVWGTLQATRSLSEALKNLTNLQDLSFHFEENILKDSSAKNICLAIKQMTNLKTLRLFFCNNVKIGDETLICLSSVITNLKDLTSLSLSFGRNLGRTPVSNKGIEKLSLVLGEMSSLRAFALDVSYLNTMDADSLRLISAALAKLELLSDLNLNFSSCRNIKATGMTFLLRTLDVLTSLRVVTLDFQEYFQLWKDDLFCLVQTLKKMPCLIKVSLYFSCCKVLSNREYIARELHNISELIF